MSVWLVETLLATSLLMALVMMIRRPVARCLGAGAAYWLWALPLARMLLPTLPQDIVTQSPLHAAVDQAGLPALLAPETMQSYAAAVPVETPFPWLELVAGIWLTGAVLFLLVQVVGYIRFRHLILRDAVPLGEEGRTRVIASLRATGPLAFGVIHPYIVLPADFALRFGQQEQEMAIAHERAHHSHGDLAANMAALGLLALHWCNPIAWIAYRAYRADQELACDARVLALYGQENAHAYGRAILKAAGGRQFAAACHLTRIATLKGRLKMLSNHDVSLRRITLGMAAIGLLTLSGLALTASGSRAAQQVADITGKVQDMKFARLADLISEPASASTYSAPQVADMPDAPAAPATPTASDRTVAPTAPVAITSGMVPPVSPIPPMPLVQVRTENNRIVITHADGRREVHRIPTEAEIRRMTPDVDVAEGCDGRNMTSTRETATANGRKRIRVRICNAEIARAAERASDQARRQADREAAQAERQAAQAERQAHLAELDGARYERQAKRAALSGLRAARARIAHQISMPAEARADALRDIDQDIADMEAGRD